MRTYSGFLLLEGILDSLPTTNSSLYGFGKRVLSPFVPVVEVDCGTTVGTVAPLNYELEGSLELATGSTLTKTRIDTLLGQGVYSVALRTTHSCVSPGGICQACYAGSYINNSIPAVGTSIEIAPVYNYQTDVLRGTGALSYFPLTEDPVNYDYALVIKNGLVQTSGYTISGLSLSTSSPLPLNQNLVVRYYRSTTQPFIGYLSKSYSGSFLGAKPLPTEELPLRSGLFQSIIDEPQLVMMEKELKTFPLILDSYLTYSSQIKNKLERALFVLTLYSLFSSAT